MRSPSENDASTKADQTRSSTSSDSGSDSFLQKARTACAVSWPNVPSTWALSSKPIRARRCWTSSTAGPLSLCLIVSIPAMIDHADIRIVPRITLTLNWQSDFSDSQHPGKSIAPCRAKPTRRYYESLLLPRMQTDYFSRLTNQSAMEISRSRESDGGTISIRRFFAMLVRFSAYERA